MGKEAFMELLVQQLKNQDPLSPMDNDKFIAQLTQLSSLEGIQNLNDNLVGLAMLQQGNALMSQLTQSSALIGKKSEIVEPEKTIPRGVHHHREWIEACKGKGKTFSPFDLGGPLTELIQLANIGGIVGEPFHYDPATGEITDNAKASALLHRPYRKGWTL